MVAMSGHSKWSTIKHKKAAIDAKKGAAFTKLAREILIASREGQSGDPSMNFRLRLVIDKARAANMPMDNVDRAIKKGTGTGGDGVILEEIVYEGYGPGGAAIMLKTLTDNKNRTASEVRVAFSRGGGNLGESGSVAWIFESKAIVTVEGIDDDKAEELELAAIDAGADDFKTEEGTLEITGPPTALQSITEMIKQQGLEPANATITMLPKTLMALDSSHASQTMRLLDRIEDLEDIQEVYTNADFPDDALNSYNGS
jgi:YebC/PmpR family DNA-binding regulatory protein